MSRIDMLGAPGVGKSSLLRLLLASTALSRSWATEEEVRIIAARNMVDDREHGRLKRSGYRLALRFPGTEQLVAATLIRARAAKDLELFVDREPEFAAAVIEVFCRSERSNYRRLLGHRWFLEAAAQLAALSRWAPGLTFMSDESLSQKYYGVAPSDEADKDSVNSYFRTIPRPRAVIHVTLAAKEHQRRVRDRHERSGVVIPGHRGLAESELNHRLDQERLMAEMASAIYWERGVPVHVVDASATSPEVVIGVRAFLAEVMDDGRQGGE